MQLVEHLLRSEIRRTGVYWGTRLHGSSKFFWQSGVHLNCHFVIVNFLNIILWLFLIPKYNSYLFMLQLQSFEIQLSVPKLAEEEGGPSGFRGVFIRAPAIIEVGPEVEVLADCPVPPETRKNMMFVDNDQKVCLH